MKNKFVIMIAVSNNRDKFTVSNLDGESGAGHGWHEIMMNHG
jgi:hypothetical protein